MLSLAIGATPAHVTHPDNIAADWLLAWEYMFGTHSPHIKIPAFVKSPATIRHKAGVVSVDRSAIKNVPENCVFAGNPAKLVKKLDQGEFNSRKDFFKDPRKLAYDFDMLDRYSLQNNTFINWLKSIIFPNNTH